MITSFKHPGLQTLFNSGPGTTTVPASPLHAPCLRRLSAIDGARAPASLNIPGFGYRALSIATYEVNADRGSPSRIEFGWTGTDAADVDFH